MTPPFLSSLTRLGALAPRRTLHSTVSRAHASVVRIRDSSIYPPGAAHQSKPIISDLNWTVQDGEAWAIIEQGVPPGELGGKAALIKVCPIRACK